MTCTADNNAVTSSWTGTPTCDNINECNDGVGTHMCDTNAACTDNAGSYACTCNDGSSGAGYTGMCPANACPSTSVANSDKSEANSISGVTTDTQTVGCDDGYSLSGTATMTCEARAGQANPQWSAAPVCTAATCASVNVANSDKDSAAGGTGSETTTGTVTVTCDDGYPGSATMTCTADSGAVTSSWTNTPTCAAATCASVNVANSDKDSVAGGTGDATTTGTVEVACDDGYSGSATMTCTADVDSVTAS